MPVFDFQCSVCGSIFEALVKTSTDTLSCVECGGNDAGKMVSALSFSIKKDTHSVELK